MYLQCYSEPALSLSSAVCTSLNLVRLLLTAYSLGYDKTYSVLELLITLQGQQWRWARRINLPAMCVRSFFSLPNEPALCSLYCKSLVSSVVTLQKYVVTLLSSIPARWIRLCVCSFSEFYLGHFLSANQFPCHQLAVSGVDNPQHRCWSIALEGILLGMCISGQMSRKGHSAQKHCWPLGYDL